MPRTPPSESCATLDVRPGESLPRVSVIVPCLNEEESLGRLFFELDRLKSALHGGYELEFIFVDDGSRDGTWPLLEAHAASRSDVRLARHEQRRGIAAALATGMQVAQGEIFASLDADCTYSPGQLVALLAQLEEGVDVVVASPYHPAGEVTGVPPWRLALSRLASGGYRLLMRSKLHTYTSCVRVYRASSVAGIRLSHDGFVGIVELIWRVDQSGGRIVECPATLSVRTSGQSKMRVLNVALAHARFMGAALWVRLFANGREIRRETLKPSLTTYTS